MNKVKIIAEGGVNHNGDTEIARNLIEAAAQAGADYIKFQTFKAELLSIESASKAQYQIESSSPENKKETQYQMLKKLELTDSEFRELKNYADALNIGFLSTPFDLESLDFLASLKIDLIKISSGDITNAPLLEKSARLGLPVIISTGMSNIEEVKDAYDVLVKNGLSKEMITILQCNTEYPTPYEDVNLRVMKSLRDNFNTSVGFSDHTKGNECAFAAVALGAEVVEKHLTLDQSLDGPDHKASATPEQFKNLVEGIRHIESAMGDDFKKPSPSELKNKDVARKSIYASKNIKKGSVLSISDIVMKRPGIGLSPMRYNDLIGKRLNKDIMENELIKMEDIN